MARHPALHRRCEEPQLCGRGYSKRACALEAFPLLRAGHLCCADIEARHEHAVSEEDRVNWLRRLALRWGVRKFSLVCPHCRHPASSPIFRRGRFMLGDETLVCEECGEASLVTFWRFEGLSCCSDRTEPMRGAPLSNARH
ncbi:hypothetical protein JQ614_11910 [Bradyrhizobium diazoefficiens]|nr:hypothetical protein [Bradyrhizobium diazoefficiens]MBR0887069.1 hypothetical protein [Bradyrhizobium diazoefficiens]MBR0918805.1 hypothetical protein [Bradyrhizobium diazoefficiens]